MQLTTAQSLCGGVSIILQVNEFVPRVWSLFFMSAGQEREELMILLDLHTRTVIYYGMFTER